MKPFISLQDVNLHRQEYFGQFHKPSEREQIARRLVDEYHERTEAYDRTVCTGPIGPGGGIMPVTSDERKLIYENAVRIWWDIARQAAEAKITIAELEQARREWRERRNHESS